MVISQLLAVLLVVVPPAEFDLRPVLDAIRQVETGAEADPANAIGDGGKALGPYQIHKGYWQDAVEHDLTLVANGETYQNVRCVKYSERVILAYWSRYAPRWDAETLSRIHNGGPKGHRKSSTLGYWAKVKGVMR